MKREHLFRILGLVDEDLIEEADTASSPAAVQRRRLGHIAAAAACVTLVCGATLSWFITGGFRGFGAAQAPGESGGGSGIAHDAEPLSVEGTTFMSYAGPVFPLATLESHEGLTASRRVTWDFAPGSHEDGTPRQWGAEVEDAYVLTNSTTGDIVATASYPYAGDLSGLSQAPSLTVDNEPLSATVSAGAYAGSFTDANMPAGSSWNLSRPDSWTDYRTLLADGTYRTAAYGEAPALDLPAVVYEFTDFQAPHTEHDAASQAIEFTIDPAATTVLTYGFNGGSWDEETGWQQRSFFVPNGVRRDPEPKLLVVLGEDIGDYTLQGYEDGGCDPGEELDTVSCTVIRTETTLSTALDQLCRAYLEDRTFVLAQDQQESLRQMEFSLFRNAAAELLTQHGPLAGENAADRYSDGRLDELIMECLTVDRVLYLTFEITIPAGSSVSLQANLCKAPSFDYGCSDSETRDLQGYDLVTQLGSDLTFTGQTAALTNTETIEIVNQNMGFDLKNGVDTVELSPDAEHYYLEIRPVRDEE